MFPLSYTFLDPVLIPSQLERAYREKSNIGMRLRLRLTLRLERAYREQSNIGMRLAVKEHNPLPHSPGERNKQFHSSQLCSELAVATVFALNHMQKCIVSIYNL